MAAKVGIQVAIDDDHITDVAGVAERLAAAGMDVQRLLPEIGAVVGSVDPARLELLRRVDGVAAVEESREVEIPPAESDIQ